MANLSILGLLFQGLDIRLNANDFGDLEFIPLDSYHFQLAESVHRVR